MPAPSSAWVPPVAGEERPRRHTAVRRCRLHVRTETRRPLDSSLCGRGLAISNEQYRATHVECGVLPHAVGRARRTGDVTMTDLQQQALDSFYALDNVITVKITMPQAEGDAVRNEEQDGGRGNFEWTGGSRFTWQ